MNNEKLKEIKEIIKDIYEGEMSASAINAFAQALHNSLFIEQYDLEDISAIVCEYEADAGIENTEWFYVFSRMIDLLEDNAVTAKRLYNSFMYECDLLDTFLKLYNDNAEYLSAEELSNVKEKALRIFDHQILEEYGIEEE